jgi:hypothetical protein
MTLKSRARAMSPVRPPHLQISHSPATDAGPTRINHGDGLSSNVQFRLRRLHDRPHRIHLAPPLCRGTREAQQAERCAASPGRG